MAKYSFDHIHLFSADPVKTAKFYEAMFNAKVTGTRNTPDGRVGVDLDIGGCSILIAARKDGVSPGRSENRYGLDHFGLKTDDLEKAAADLKAKGVEFRDEIRAPRPGMKIAFIWAPDNVVIELVERKE